MCYDQQQKLRSDFFQLGFHILQLPPILLCQPEDPVSPGKPRPAGGALIVHPGEAVGADQVLLEALVNRG